MKTLPHPGPPPTVGEGKVGGIFVAEAAEIANVHQGSTHDAKRLDHNVPLCTTYFSGRVFGNEGFLGELVPPLAGLAVQLRCSGIKP